jgi:hypothetical protein
MPFSHCDASGLVKRYVDEVGSDWVRAIVDPASANAPGEPRERSERRTPTGC